MQSLRSTHGEGLAYHAPEATGPPPPGLDNTLQFGKVEPLIGLCHVSEDRYTDRTVERAIGKRQGFAWCAEIC